MGIQGEMVAFGWYHCLDYALFWFNIRENVRVRTEAYLNRGG